LESLWSKRQNDDNWENISSHCIGVCGIIPDNLDQDIMEHQYNVCASRKNTIFFNSIAWRQIHPKHAKGRAMMRDFLQKNYYWIAGLLAMAVASVVAIVKSAWTMSKEHQRLQKIQEDVAEIKDAQKKFMTADEHLKIQQINNNIMHQEFDEKYRRLTAAVFDEITTTNANICKLLERQGLTPVDQSGRNRRITDYLENLHHE
jgi:hypothetical protein